MNVLIVEDELYTAELLQEIIEQDDDFMVVEKLESIIDTVAYLSKHQKNLDLLFFDIELGDGQSFEIFKHIDIVIPVIFCTAYDEYAINAFKNNGIDYVLKPIKESAIHEALSKYKKLFTTQKDYNIEVSSFEALNSKNYQKKFLTQLKEKTIIVSVEEIAAFSVQNDTVYLYTFTGKKYPIYKKLEYVESVCDPDKFFRINRQVLVSREAIVSFEPYFNRKIVLQLSVEIDQTVVVSRLKVSSFKNWLEH